MAETLEPIRQVIYRLDAKLETIAEKQTEMARSGERRDQRIEELHRGLNEVATSVAGLAAKAETLRHDVTTMQRPVEQFVALRRHLYAMGALAVSIASSLWFVASPMVSWFTNHVLTKFFESPKP